MQVTLTLNRGSFYFMKNLHLVRDVPTKVDLSTLDNVELSGLKLNVQAGTILSDKPLDVSVEAPVVETQQEEVAPVEAPAVEQAKDEAEELKELSNKALKEKLAELGLEPTSNRKDDLVAQILEATK